MKTITAYKTSDGNIFENESAAKAHQMIIDFEAWYNDHELWGSAAGSRVGFDDLLEWLRDNKEKVLKFYDQVLFS